MILTAAQFAALFPRAKLEVMDFLNMAMTRCDIDSPVRMAAFLAQIGHESAGLTVVVENLNYSAEGLAATWPKRFMGNNGKPNDQARFLARKPAEIANVVYAHRNGNGNESSGDGWRYRGRGYLQVTGRYNYQLTSNALGVDFVADPASLELPQYATASAALYWYRNSLNDLADAGKFEQITRAINGGWNGMPDRKERWAKAREVLSG